MPGGRGSGTIRIASDAVHFESPAARFSLPLDGLKIALGGANDALVFLTHPSKPQTTVHTADHSLLNHPILLQNPALAAQRNVARRKRHATTAILVAVGLVILGGLAGLFLARGWLVSVAANSVPTSWEVSAGDKLFQQITLGKKLVKDPVIDAQLSQITAPLVAGIGDERYPLKFHIVEDASLNAFAIPGGNVVLHSGLLLAADSPEEVAGVLAHEIAHVTRRHSIRNIISSAGLYIVVSTLFGDASGLIGVLASNSAFLLDRKFSRDFEREADDVGLEYLRAARIDPRGMIEFFRKLQAEEKKLRDKLPVTGADAAFEALSTHPATNERVERLEAKVKAKDPAGYRSFTLDYAAFKTVLRSKLHSSSGTSQP